MKITIHGVLPASTTEICDRFTPSTTCPACGGLTLEVAPNTPLKELPALIEAQGFQKPVYFLDPQKKKTVPFQLDLIHQVVVVADKPEQPQPQPQSQSQTDSQPSSSSASSSPLSIVLDESLSRFYTDWCYDHGTAGLPSRCPGDDGDYRFGADRGDENVSGPFLKGVTRAALKDNSTLIRINGLKIDFQRTIRIPDHPDQKLNFDLPPGLGAFPLYNVAQFKRNFPPHVRIQGGVFFPMYQREAMWIRFQASDPCAVKIGVGKVNAISGQTWAEGLSSQKQDYIVCPTQPWLDGIFAGDGLIRQFVAMPLGSGYTVEGQVTGKEQFGGLQIEVFPTMLSDFKVSTDISMQPPIKNLNATPQSLGLKPGDVLYFSSPKRMGVRHSLVSDLSSPELRARFDTFSDLYEDYDFFYVKTLEGKAISVKFAAQKTILQVKNDIQNKEGIPPDQQRIIFAGRMLEDWFTLAEYNVRPGSVVHLVLRLTGGGGGIDPGILSSMGLAAGGQMKQKIYADTFGVQYWDTKHAEKIFVHIVDSATFQRCTGLAAPQTPVTMKTYKECKLPWFELYDEHVPAAKSSATLAAVKSVGKLDKEKKVFDEQICPICQHRLMDTKLRPCGHDLCADCAGKLQQCPICRAKIMNSQPFAAMTDEDEAMDQGVNPHLVVCYHHPLK